MEFLLKNESKIEKHYFKLSVIIYKNLSHDTYNFSIYYFTNKTSFNIAENISLLHGNLKIKYSCNLLFV